MATAVGAASSPIRAIPWPLQPCRWPLVPRPSHIGPPVPGLPRRGTPALVCRPVAGATRARSGAHGRRAAACHRRGGAIGE